jgi:acyl-CoA synthetase (NDP forming)/GNAT superfamily N-acetyltransferase
VRSRDEWATSVVLADGETGYVRAITPEDAPLLLAFHERQPRENLYRRFFSPKPSLTESELAHFTQIDFVDRVALVMEIHGEFAAWASYERWPGRPDADVAFMVDDVLRGKGIAMLLLEHLAAIARSNGIQRFTADVLADNRPMLSVFSKAGWPVSRHFDSGVMELEFPLVDTEGFIETVELREHRADSRSVARLLLPRSIAVIGASDVPGSIGHELWRNITTHTHDIPLFPVNARHPTVGGVPAFPTLLDVEDDVWLAVIAVPAAHLAEVIEQCITKRVRGAVVITALEGSELEAAGEIDAIVDHARRNGLRIIGPASMGIAGATGMQAALVPVELPRGGVAISMQSGSLGASMLGLASQMSMGLSWFVSLGDKSDVSGNDLLQFWEDDEATTVIAMYTESFGNPRKFARIARRVARRKPIVAVRTGAAALGTASEALYQQAGLIEVPTVRAMLDTARVLATQPIPAGPRVAILSNSRSPGVLAAAAVGAAGLEAVAAPLPLDWRADNDAYGDAVRAAVADPGVDAVLVIHAPPIASAPAPSIAIDSAASGVTKPVVAVMLGRHDGPVLDGSSVPSFAFPEPAVAVLGHMYAYRRWLDTEADAATTVLEGVDDEAATAVLNDAVDRGETTATLDAACKVLAAYGVAMPPTEMTTSATPDELAERAAAIGFPVSIKALHRRPGRSAEAGVALDLPDEDAVHDAVQLMRLSLGPDADFLAVQQMVPPGVDVRIRCTSDDRLGPVVTVGLGGINADAIGDETSRLAPVSAAAAANLVHASRAGAALAGARIGIEQLVDTIVRVGRLVADHPEIAELDLNPVIVGRAGCHVVDARLELSADIPAESPLRRLV